MTAVSIDQLSVAQLGSVKKQLDDEVDHLALSVGRLKAVQQRFRGCTQALQALSPDSTSMASLA